MTNIITKLKHWWQEQTKLSLMNELERDVKTMRNDFEQWQINRVKKYPDAPDVNISFDLYLVEKEINNPNRD